MAEALDVPLGSRVPTPDLIAAVEKVRAGKGMLLDDAGPDARTVGSVFLSPRLAPDHADRLRAAGAPVHQFPDGSTRVSASWLMRDAGLALGEFLAPGVRVSTRHYTLVADDTAGPTATAEAFVDRSPAGPRPRPAGHRGVADPRTRRPRRPARLPATCWTGPNAAGGAL